MHEVHPAQVRNLSYQANLSSRTERTRISYFAAPDTTACAVFFKEDRMLLAGATKLHRKSGGA